MSIYATESFALTNTPKDLITYVQWYNGILDDFSAGTTITDDGPLGQRQLNLKGLGFWAQRQTGTKTEIFHNVRMRCCLTRTIGSVFVGFTNLGFQCQTQIRFDFTTGIISAYRSGVFGGETVADDLNASTFLGASDPNVFDPTYYHYFEFYLKVDDTAGAVTVRVGAGPGNPTREVLKLTNVPTSYPLIGGVKTVGLIGFNAAPGLDGDPTANTMQISHLVSYDKNGFAPTNDFLGDCGVYVREAVGAGEVQQWQPFGHPENWLNVSSRDPDADTNFNKNAVAGRSDTYLMDAADPLWGYIYGLMIVGLYDRRNGTDTKHLVFMLSKLLIPAFDSLDFGVSLDDPMVFASGCFTKDPSTGTPWSSDGMGPGQLSFGQTMAIL